MTLWLCIHLPDLALEATAEGANTPVAVIETLGPRRIVIGANEAARAQGVQSGMAVTEAQSLLPTVRIRLRRPREEQTVLVRLAGWALQYTSFVHLPEPPPEPGAGRLLLEIGGSLRLFGGQAAVIERITSELAALGYTAQTGIAAQPKAAALLARGPDCDRITDLPTALLELPPETLKVLQASGLRRIGDILALPRPAVGRRFGMACLDYLARLTGELPDALDAFQPPAHYHARVEFAAEVESIQALRFPLRRLVGELAGSLRGQDAAIQHLALDLGHADRDPTRIQLRLAQPTRQADPLLTLIEERLARVRLPAPVRTLCLSTGRFRAFTPPQSDLFDARPHEAEALSHLLDRLQARLGDDAVSYLQTAADHRPEQACQLTADPDTGTNRPYTLQGRRPVWLLDPPRPLTTTPTLVSGPERIESGWWAADVGRDYYVAHTPDGRRLWIFRERGKPKRWYLHGLFA